MDSLEVLRKLIEVPGVSGYEEPVREAIRRMLPEGINVYVDEIGNLIADLGGGGDTIVLAAHMDELGLVVTHIEDDGLIKFRKLGGIDDRILPSMRVEIHTSKGSIPGVIGVTPPHLQLDRTGDSKVIPWHELYIDIGASSRDEALDMGVRVLDPVTLDKSFTLIGKGAWVAARSIDDRMGCAVLVQLAHAIASGSMDPKHHVILAWTVQEEVGLRGAMALAERVKPSLFVAVDTMSCCLPGITGEAKPGRGPVIRAIDNAYIADRRLVSKLAAIAESRGIPYQIATAGGGTDAAALQRRGVRVLALGAPVKYTHSTVEMLNVQDFKGMIELVKAIVEEPPV